MGTGTPLIESLTSYITRLASNHVVGPREFIDGAMGPVLARVRARGRPGAWSFYRWEAAHLNGALEWVDEWVRDLEALTGRRDLRGLTARPWADGLRSRGLGRRSTAWCAACLATWRDEGSRIYLPLLWSVRVVRICPVHKSALQDQCPFCGRLQYSFGRQVPLGHCTRCARWLGTREGSGADPVLPAGDMAWQEWVVHALGDLVVASQRHPLSAGRGVVEGLAICAQALGSAERLARAANLDNRQLWRWRTGARRLELETVMRVCYTLGIAPLHLLAAHRPALESSLAAAPPGRVAPSRRATAHPLDVPAARAAVDAAVAAVLPPPVAELARRLHVSPHTLETRFPDECVRIRATRDAARQRAKREKVEREQASVRDVAVALHARGIYPSIRAVRKALPRPGILSEAHGLAAWQDALRELGLRG